MKKVLVRGALVLGVAGAVVAPQVHWLLLSGDRDALSAVEVESAAAERYTSASSQVLDRIECEPIAKAPGRSVCQAQDEDEVFGLVLEVKADGSSELFRAPATALKAWSGS